MRIIRHILSNEGIDFGNHLVLVPVDNSDNPQYAIVDVNDFYRLVDNRCTKYWKLDKQGNVILWGSKGRRPCLVKRLIMNAGPGQAVNFKDGNKQNLRRYNLEIADHANAKHSEWDFINFNNIPTQETNIIHQWEYRPPILNMGQHMSFIGKGDYPQERNLIHYGSTN